jgi:hypothetical protein
MNRRDREMTAPYYGLRMMRGFDAEPNSRECAPNAYRADKDCLLLAVLPDDLTQPTAWLRETASGWEVCPTPAGLRLLPPDFDDSDLEFAGYYRVFCTGDRA